jgi:hypothetical protein
VRALAARMPGRLPVAQCPAGVCRPWHGSPSRIPRGETSSARCGVCRECRSPSLLERAAVGGAGVLRTRRDGSVHWRVADGAVGDPRPLRGSFERVPPGGTRPAVQDAADLRGPRSEASARPCPFGPWTSGSCWCPALVCTSAVVRPCRRADPPSRPAAASARSADQQWNSPPTCREGEITSRFVTGDRGRPLLRSACRHSRDRRAAMLRKSPPGPSCSATTRWPRRSYQASFFRARSGLARPGRNATSRPAETPCRLS